jgi:hypothetical protein
VEDLKQKIAELEKRLEIVESALFSSGKNVAPPEIPMTNRPSSLIKINISKKKYSPVNLDMGQFEEHIWFNITYLAGTLDKPTRAIKGALCFSDVFGETKFRLNVTLNERLDPNRPLLQEGIGFTYNQFIPEHQWMLATQEQDMKFSFIVTNVIYADGSSEEF